MESHTFHQRTRILFGPLAKYYRIVLVMTLTIVAVLCFMSYRWHLFAMNNDDALVLSAEFLTEVGPDFKRSCDAHGEVLAHYIHVSEGKPLSSLLSKYERLLEDTYDDLQKASKGSQEEACQAIWRAGENFLRYHMDSGGFLGRRIIWRRSRQYIDPDLTKKIKTAVDATAQQADRLRDDPSFEGAWQLCESNRKAMLLLYLSRSAYKDKDSIDRLSYATRQARDMTLELEAEMLSDGPRAQLLMEYARGEERRIHILEALQKGDMKEARLLYRSMLEHDSRTRAAILNLAKDLVAPP